MLLTILKKYVIIFVYLDMYAAAKRWNGDGNEMSELQ